MRAAMVAKEIELLKKGRDVNHAELDKECHTFIREVNQYVHRPAYDVQDEFTKLQLKEEYEDDAELREIIAAQTQAYIEAVSWGKANQNAKLHAKLLAVEENFKRREEADKHYFTIRELAQHIVDNKALIDDAIQRGYELIDHIMFSYRD